MFFSSFEKVSIYIQLFLAWVQLCKFHTPPTLQKLIDVEYNRSAIHCSAFLENMKIKKKGQEGSKSRMSKGHIFERIISAPFPLSNKVVLFYFCFLGVQFGTR